MRDYKRSGYTAAYKRLRFSQAANDNRNFAWIGEACLYIILAIGPILFFWFYSFILNLYFR